MLFTAAGGGREERLTRSDPPHLANIPGTAQWPLYTPIITSVSPYCCSQQKFCPQFARYLHAKHFNFRQFLIRTLHCCNLNRLLKVPSLLLLFCEVSIRDKVVKNDHYQSILGVQIIDRTVSLISLMGVKIDGLSLGKLKLSFVVEGANLFINVNE